MIPKTIHYCWFSGAPYPDLVKRCLRSWKRMMPDYKLRLWDGNSFDFDSVPYVREAMAAKKYAVASDYVRLYALYTEGGIYLDSDVKIYKSFDTFLNNTFFSGTEPYIIDNKIYYDIECAIIGSEKGHPFLKEALDYYNNIHYTPDNHNTVCLVLARLLEKYGYTSENKLYNLSNDVTIYPLDHIHDKYSFYDQSAIHWCQGSWLDYPEKSRLYYFCARNGLMGFYHWLERIRGTRKQK
jgi:mannosyltransferase OCH1-like enzyme